MKIKDVVVVNVIILILLQQMSQNSNKLYQSLSSELQLNIKQKNFDVKLIPTFGVFRPSQLEAIGSMQIREESLKQLITNILKLCYLYDPIIKTLHELQNTPDAHYYNPNNLLKVSILLQILSENLFYSNIMKLKVDSNTVIHLVNSRPTELNRRVIIAGILVYVAKRLSLEEIGTALLVFNLEEALLKLRPFGLPLDHNLLLKCIKKINRVVNINDLKIFIQTAREQGEELTENDKQDIINNIKMDANNEVNIKRSEMNLQYLLGPDQFLYLVALSERKSSSSSIFISNFDHSNQKKLGIDAFMLQKKLQYTSGMEIQNNNYISSTTQKKEEQKDNNESGTQGIHYNCPVREKVRGLSLYSSQSQQIKSIKHHESFYKQLKKQIKNKNNPVVKHQRILSSNLNSKQMNKYRANFFLRQTNMLLFSNQNNNLSKKRVNSRPYSSTAYRKSLKIVQKCEQMDNYFNKQLRRTQIVSKIMKNNKMFYGDGKEKQVVQKEKQKEKEKRKKNTVQFVTTKQIRTVSNYDSKQEAQMSEISRQISEKQRIQKQIQSQKQKIKRRYLQYQSKNEDPLFLEINHAFFQQSQQFVKSSDQNIFSQIQTNVENHFINVPSTIHKSRSLNIPPNMRPSSKSLSKKNCINEVKQNNVLKNAPNSSTYLMGKFGKNSINILKDTKNKKIIKLSSIGLKIYNKN